MQSIYVLTFKSGGDMEDIVIFTSYEKAIEHLSKQWKTKSILEYRLDENGVSDVIYAIYDMLSDGSITKLLYDRT